MCIFTTTNLPTKQSPMGPWIRPYLHSQSISSKKKWMPSFDSPYLIGLFTHRSPLMIAVLASSSANQNDGNCSKNGTRIRQYHRRRWSYDKMDTASRFPALNRSSYPSGKAFRSWFLAYHRQIKAIRNCGNGTWIHQYLCSQRSDGEMDTTIRFLASNGSIYPQGHHSNLSFGLIVGKSKQSVISEMGHESINTSATSGATVTRMPSFDPPYRIGIST